MKLLAQIFRLATELLLLPAAIYASLLLVLALLRELLLAASQLFQLLHRVIDLLLLFIGARRLLRFVLVLLGIQLQVEKVRQIAAGILSAASATAATLAAGYLNVAERRHGARKVLKRLVLGLQRVRPLLVFQLVRRRSHFSRGRFHFLGEALEILIFRRELASRGALGHRLGLIFQLGLHFGQILGVFGVGLSVLAATIEVMRRRDNLLLALGDLAGIVLLPAAATAASATLLRLRKVALIGLRLDKRNVADRLRASVIRRGIHRDDIARNQLEVFEAENHLAFGRRGSLSVQKRNHLLGLAVDRVMQVHGLQREIVRARNGNGDFLNGTHLRVRSGMRDLHRRRFIHLGFDEVILRNANILSAFFGGEVIGSVLLDRDLGRQHITLLRFQVDLGPVVELDEPVLQRTIGFHFQLRDRLDNRAQIAARILNVVFLAEPRRVVIRDLDVLHAGQIDDIQLVCFRLYPRGFDVVFNRFRHR